MIVYAIVALAQFASVSVHSRFGDRIAFSVLGGMVIILAIERWRIQPDTVNHKEYEHADNEPEDPGLDTYRPS